MAKNKIPQSFKSVFFILSFLLMLILFIMNVEVANPSSWPFYNFKRFYETVQLRMKITPEAKLNYLYKLLDKRLIELGIIIKDGNSSYVLASSLRYSTTAGQITELITLNNLKNESQKAEEKFKSQLSIVKNFQQKYPKTDGEVKYIIDDANYLEIYIGQLSSL